MLTNWEQNIWKRFAIFLDIKNLRFLSLSLIVSLWMATRKRIFYYFSQHNKISCKFLTLFLGCLLLCKDISNKWGNITFNGSQQRQQRCKFRFTLNLKSGWRRINKGWKVMNFLSSIIHKKIKLFNSFR